MSLLLMCLLLLVIELLHQALWDEWTEASSGEKSHINWKKQKDTGFWAKHGACAC